MKYKMGELVQFRSYDGHFEVEIIKELHYNRFGYSYHVRRTRDDFFFPALENELSKDYNTEFIDKFLKETE